MDYTIAPGTTAVGAGDVAPATGTPGEFTNGNPATATPATVLPGYQMNALVQEIRNTIVGAGLTPSGTNNAQLLPAIQALATPSLLHSYATAGTFTFTVPSNLYWVYTECTAGGGGGGYGAASNFGSGGGGGGWGAKRIPVTPGQTIAVVVGAAGAAGTSGAAATNGGASSVGAVLSCTGGGAGISNGVNPGGGGVPTGADFGFAGGIGQGGFQANASTFLGGAGAGVPRVSMSTNYAANGPGNGPNGAGAGGGAGANGNNGAAGAPGQVLIFAG